MDTVGVGRARSEYAATVVLWWEFWLQSTKTFPFRSSFFITLVTRFGSCFSRSWATARAKDEACSWVWGVLSGT